MPTIKYITADGIEHRVEIAVGGSAMQAALDNAISGIDGDCGGNAACGTCHVFVDTAWIGVTGPATEGPEVEMLSLTEGYRETSRLACQISVTDKLDGLVLHLPKSQF